MAAAFTWFDGSLRYESRHGLAPEKRDQILNHRRFRTRFCCSLSYSFSFFRVEILPKMFPPSGEGKAKLTATPEALKQDKQSSDRATTPCWDGQNCSTDKKPSCVDSNAFSACLPDNNFPYRRTWQDVPWELASRSHAGFEKPAWQKSPARAAPSPYFAFAPGR